MEVGTPFLTGLAAAFKEMEREFHPSKCPYNPFRNDKKDGCSAKKVADCISLMDPSELKGNRSDYTACSQYKFLKSLSSIQGN